MEVNLIEEEAKIEKINGHNALQYVVKNNGKNINKVPIYKQWLDLAKTEKGENGVITYCTKCHVFIYFTNHEEKHNRFHKDCYYEDLSEFCEYCGELYNEDSICCFKKLLQLFERITGELFGDFYFWALIIPIVILYMTFLFTFKIIYSKRNKKDDINYINYIYESDCNILFFIIFIPMGFVYSLTFLIPYHIIYFFQLYYIIKLRNQYIRDKENNIFRY